MTEPTLQIPVDEILPYLDKAIESWRKKREFSLKLKNGTEADLASHYVDAFQSVRVSLFGSLKT